MEIKLLFWTALIAFILAKVEIQIEGKDGWAKNLPTWKANNKLIRTFFNGNYITGYHLWMFLLIFALMHFPFIFNSSWNLSLEFKILGFITLLWVLEDFLWFILNPFYGIKKFSKNNIPWHKNWIGPIPSNYLIGLGLVIILLYFSSYFRS